MAGEEAGMKLRDEGESAARFEKYVDALASVIGHADRVGPLHDYCTGLILPGDRKSVEPMASRLAPGDYARARAKLNAAYEKDPTNPHILANLELLEKSARAH